MTSLIILCSVLAIIQYIAALPWLMAWDPKWRTDLLKSKSLGIALLACVGVGVAAAFFLHARADQAVLERWGRLYGFILQIQLICDFFVVAIVALLYYWPKGGAVALAAFRESVRQPMFWLLGAIALGLLLLTPLLPYFTMGDDLKMVKEICFSFTMIIPALFGVVAASLSVHEEIEGRTTVTLMSKPVSRRQFLLGKFAGIAFSALLMTLMLGGVLVWVVWYKRVFQSGIHTEEIPDPQWVVGLVQGLTDHETAAGMLRGWGLWLAESFDALPHLIIGFCQAMVLIAVAVALATRMPMIINVVICLLVYFLGHLTPIMTAVAANELVFFVAQVFDTLLPALDLFDVSTAIARDVPLPTGGYLQYTAQVVMYGVGFTIIALLFGLILFEDRDLG